MILAAHQPQFLPWLGYFDKMARADAFVLLDDVQFKKNEWQNRNKIWSREGGHWLTVPVVHGHLDEIRAVKLDETSAWRKKHLATLEQTYSRAKHFKAGWEPWRLMYEAPRESLLDINLYSIERVRDALGIKTPMPLSSTLAVEGKSTERLVNLCRKLGADTYLAGAGGRDYMDTSLFDKAGIKVAFQEYRHPVYEQFGGPFVSHLAAIDLLFHLGPDARAAFEAGR
jgi:hypothetical protein